jgi:hypothetical protein
MKLIEVIRLRNNLQIIEPFDGFKLNYAIKRNLETLKSVIQPLTDQENEINKILNEYNKERVILCEEHSKVDGKPIIVDGNYVPVNLERFNNDFILLREKHAQSIADFEIKTAEFNKFLSENDSDFKIYQVNINEVPENLSSKNTELIYPLIKE